MERREISRVQSPDHHVTAVVVSALGGGAAGASEYYVYIVENQANEKLDHPVFTASNCAGLSAAWIDNKSLQVSYPSGCMTQIFVNQWYSQSDVQNARHASVEIVLTKKPGNETERLWMRPEAYKPKLSP